VGKREDDHGGDSADERASDDAADGRATGKSVGGFCEVEDVRGDGDEVAEFEDEEKELRNGGDAGEEKEIFAIESECFVEDFPEGHGAQVDGGHSGSGEKG